MPTIYLRRCWDWSDVFFHLDLTLTVHPLFFFQHLPISFYEVRSGGAPPRLRGAGPPAGAADAADADERQGGPLRGAPGGGGVRSR